MKPYLLFTSAGDNCILLKNNINNWLSHPNNLFDICICFYGNDLSSKIQLQNNSQYFFENKGGKFQNLVWLYLNHNHIFKKYKYIFVIDDDIIINTMQINFLFIFAHYFNACIVQPAFKDVKECRIDHPINKQVKHLFARKVNYIEQNTPLFNTSDLILFLEYLIQLNEPILAGWGNESLYSHFYHFIIDKSKLTSNGHFYILDAISCINPLIEDCKREISKLQSTSERKKAWENLSLKYNIPNISYSNYKIDAIIKQCPKDIFFQYLVSLDPNHFCIEKPLNWYELPFFKKIRYYGENLTQNYSYFVDKLSAKIIVKYICNDLIKTSKVVKILNNIDDIIQDDLKDGFILKSSHASGWNLIMNNNSSLEEVKNKLISWNKQYNASFEKQYSYLEPKFFIEEIIDDKFLGKNGNAYVYMIRCIRGKPLCVNIKLFEKQNYYNLDWTPFLPFQLPDFEKPKNLDLMIKLASILSSNFEFVRIDFHIDINDDIYFSEYTFTPFAGNRVFPLNIEYELGKDW